MDALVAYIGFPLVWYIGGHAGRPHDPAQAAGAFALLTGFLSLVITIAGAVPVVHWLMKRGPVSLMQLIRVGLILGNAPFLLSVIGLVLPMTLLHLITGTMSEHLISLSNLTAGTLRAIGIGSVIGVWSAVVFWLLGIRGTDPDIRIPLCW